MDNQKKLTKEELVAQIYKKAKRKAPFVYWGTGYYRIDPTPITMDDGRVINVEWIQPSAFDDNVLINYQTDCLKTTKLSEKELAQILEII